MSAVRLLLPIVALLAACSTGSPRVEIATARGTVTVTVEVAATDPSRQQGLMYRKDLAPQHGMLFLFDTEEEHAFWMKNTLIPLDMIFIAGDGRIVGIKDHTTPFSTAGVTVGTPSRYVLEIGGGEAARLGIKAGDHLTMHDIRAG